MIVHMFDFIIAPFTLLSIHITHIIKLSEKRLTPYGVNLNSILLSFAIMV